MNSESFRWQSGFERGCVENLGPGSDSGWVWSSAVVALQPREAVRSQLNAGEEEEEPKTGLGRRPCPCPALPCEAPVMLVLCHLSLRKKLPRSSLFKTAQTYYFTFVGAAWRGPLLHGLSQDSSEGLSPGGVLSEAQQEGSDSESSLWSSGTGWFLAGCWTDALSFLLAVGFGFLPRGPLRMTVRSMEAGKREVTVLSSHHVSDTPSPWPNLSG